MVNIVQVVLTWLSWSSTGSRPQDSLSSAQTPSANKSIAIIGAGSAGLAALKAFLDLPIETRQSWSIVLFEQRRDVGGIWLPDPDPPHPPVLPSTPLYPRLHTNTPHPWMTCPQYPFPPMTPLYPQHERVLAYHRDYSEKFGLRRYIRFNTTVLQTSWLEREPKGIWNIQTQHHLEGNLRASVKNYQFDHLIVASGHNHYPAFPDFPGSQRWLDNTPSGSLKRSILHSIFFRDANDYANRTVVVVGGGASGLDVASQIEPVAGKVYLSLKENVTTLPINSSNIILKPSLSHFTRDGPVFTDNTCAVDADVLILATGYEFRVPFLDVGGVMRTDPSAISRNSTHGYRGLTTNLRYIFPLHEMIFSLSSKFPPTALSFVGLPILVANFPVDRAQGLFVAHAIANDSILPPRDDLLAQLASHEADLESQGIDPYYVGHRLVGEGEGEDYQDRIVQFLKEKGVIPQDGHRYVEQWRRDLRINAQLLRKAWTRIESQGKAEERKWLQGVTTEEEWASLLYRMVRWQRQHEEEQRMMHLMITHDTYI